MSERMEEQIIDEIREDLSYISLSPYAGIGEANREKAKESNQCNPIFESRALRIRMHHSDRVNSALLLLGLFSR